MLCQNINPLGEDMKMLGGVLIVLLFCVALGSMLFAQQAQTITIRIIDVSKGRSLQKQQVMIYPLYTGNDKTSIDTSESIQLETGTRGDAQFHVTEPMPNRLMVKVILSHGHWWCGSIEFADVQEVIQKGIVGLPPGPKPKKTDVTVNPVPGEIIFLARPMTFFERLIHPLVKG